MIKQGSGLAESSMHFRSDKNADAAKLKSNRIKKERRDKNQIIKDNLDE